MTHPFTCTLRGHCSVINWPNFNIVVSQGIGERQGNGQLVMQSEHTQHLSIKFAIFYGRGSWHPKTITTVMLEPKVGHPKMCLDGILIILN